MGGKQTQRNEKKKAAKVAEQDDAPEATSTENSFGDLFKMLFLGSAIMTVAPKLQGIFTPTDDSKKEAEAKVAEAEEKVEGEVSEESEKVAEVSLDTADSIFAFLKERIGLVSWHNCLGLASPASAEESIAAWMALKELEVDWGPKSKKNKSNGLDRIKVNLMNNMPQYLHILLALMMLRTFLFKTFFFGMLPWLVGCQILSLYVPLDDTPIPQLPQLKEHISKCPVKFRVAGSVGIHALLWLFFAYEVLWGMWFFEKGLVAGAISYHAYAVRPAAIKAS